MTTFDEGAERNKALGIWGAIAGIGGAAGVLLGGVLTDTLGWEWIFLVNVPVGILVILLTPRFVAESHAEGATRAFDVAGAVSVTAGLALLVYALVNTDSRRLGLGRDDRPAGRLRRPARRLRRHRDARQGAAPAPEHLPAAQPHRGQHRRAAARGRDLLDVLLPVALHAAGAGLLRAADRLRVPAGGGRDHHRGGGLPGPGHALRRQGDPGHRDGPPDPGPPLVHDDRRQRLLRHQPGPRLPAVRRRPGLRVRAGLDRGPPGRAAARGGHRLGPHQHVPADRRRAGHRHPRHHRHHPHRLADARGRAAARRRCRAPSPRASSTPSRWAPAWPSSA